MCVCVCVCVLRLCAITTKNVIQEQGGVGNFYNGDSETAFPRATSQHRKRTDGEEQSLLLERVGTAQVPIILKYLLGNNFYLRKAHIRI